MLDWNGHWDEGVLGKADDIASAANLGGVGVVAATDSGLLAVNAAADWIPVAGEVVMGATALYLAGSWLYENWDSVKAVGEDVAKGVEWLDHEQVKLVDDAAGFTVDVAKDTGEAAVDAAKDTGKAIVDGADAVGSTAEKAAKETGHLASAAAHKTLSVAKKAVEPWNW